ncbi:MAG TPA: DUF5714 domain-containing protein, partial [Anaeromyxobacter sp.]
LTDGAMTEHRTGCLVCGAAIEYLQAAADVSCATCGALQAGTARCAAGHFVCDGCHSGSAKDVIERFCAATASTDPVEISRVLMRHPKVKMHGPEHHFLVPAALLAAHANARGEPGEKRRLLAEARRRSEPVAGGFCGYQGACGAAIGAGIYASIASGATPLAREPWALANAATAKALEVVSRVGGPRCCKRTTWLVLLSAIRFARERLGVALAGRGARCEHSALNRECIEARCPFHPSPGVRGPA